MGIPYKRAYALSSDALTYVALTGVSRVRLGGLSVSLPVKPLIRCCQTLPPSFWKSSDEKIACLRRPTEFLDESFRRYRDSSSEAVAAFTMEVNAERQWPRSKLPRWPIQPRVTSLCQTITITSTSSPSSLQVSLVMIMSYHGFNAST